MIIVNFAGQSLSLPGSYTNVIPATSAVTAPSLGILALIGEADEGLPFSSETGLSAVTFGPDEFGTVADKFQSGELLDAMKLCIAPSNDPQIPGGAQQFILLKTNQSTRASLAIPTGYGTLSAMRYGAPGNLISSQVTLGTSGTAILTTTGNITTSSASLAALASTTGIAVGQTVTGTGIPAGTTVTAISGSTVTMSQNATTTTTGLSVQFLGTTAVITNSRLDTGVSEISAPLGNNTVLTIQCTDAGATAATLTYTDTAITTTVTGGSTAQNLAIDPTKYATVKQLIDYINAQPGYTAVLVTGSTQLGQLSLDVLDRVTAANIKNAFSWKKDAFECRDFWSKSGLVVFTPTVKSGLPNTLAKTYLTGGARGATSQANIQSCFDALLKTRVNFVCPLFSQDATADITAGKTDAGSAYTISATHQAALSHVTTASTVKGRKERIAGVGFKGTFAATQDAGGAVASNRIQMCFQDVSVSSYSQNAVVSKQPHMLAAMALAMKCSAPVGLANTFKLVQIAGFTHTDFEPSTMGETAVNANLCYVETNPGGGFRFRLDNSTYALAANAWIYNRPSVQYAADVAAYAIRLNTETFVGQRNSDVTTESVKNLLVGVMDQLRSAGILVADASSAGRGYKDLLVTIQGSIININVTLILVENLEFVLSTIKVQRAG